MAEPVVSGPPYRLIGVEYHSRAELIERLREGLSPDAFDELCALLDLTAAEVQGLARIPQRTLYRRRKDGHLQPDESERLLRLARLYEAAERVLVTRERALAWLKKPHRALGDRSPLAYADTDLGAREVEDLLGRIEHGISY